MLEQNKRNRPLSDQHVERLKKAILGDHWKINGDTIKFARSGDVLDGQHRLWAVVEANKSIWTYVVYGIEDEAFSTIDTARRVRRGADVLAVAGAERHRSVASSALGWLIRYQRKALTTYREPSNRVENRDIETAWLENPGIIRSCEAVGNLSGLVTRGPFAFLHYVIATRNPDLADRMISTLSAPSKVSLDDPFFRLRVWFTASRGKRDPLMVIALTFKAANAAVKEQKIKRLVWQSQGSNAEEFPKLEI